MAVDRSTVSQARQAFAQARANRLQAQADLASKNATLAALSRTLPASDSQAADAQQAVQTQTQAVSDARDAEKQAAFAVAKALQAWLAETPARDVARLESRFPIVLMPLRLETRFVPESMELRVRIYPDEISCDAHEPELSGIELQAGSDYWKAATDTPSSMSAWATLLQHYSPQRAAWIVLSTDPAQITKPAFVKPPGWSRAVEARLLPDRFVVVATRGTTVKKTAFGSPVVEPLAVSMGPDSLDSDQARIGPDQTFKLDESVQWTIDWDKAVAAGMGIRLPIDQSDLTSGFERLIVVGVKASMDPEATRTGLGALFDAHHYTGGLAFVKQGTPTSNTIGTPAGFPMPDPNGAASFAVERGGALDGVGGDAADRVNLALGLPRGVFSHVAGADLREFPPAQAMNRVLYSSTFGYFLDQVMTPIPNLTPSVVNEVGQWFTRWVVPRGMASAFRIGRVPYGILPVTSLAGWQNADNATPTMRQMATLLQRVRQVMLDNVSRAPHVGRSSDPDQDLLDILSMDASARQVRVRRCLGNAINLNMLLLFNWPSAQWDAFHQLIGKQTLRSIGVDQSQRPRVVDMTFSSQSQPYDGPLVDIVPVSEDKSLSFDYISWVRNANVDTLHLEIGVPENVKQSLLYRFLRHTALAEYHWWTTLLLEQPVSTPIPVLPSAVPVAPLLPVDHWREPELVGIVSGTEKRQTPWQRFQNQVNVPSLGKLIDVLALLFDPDFESQLRELTGVGDFRDALDQLNGLPTAELERLFGESLDAVSHRTDAWITSLAHQRLFSMRRDGDFALPSYVGAYGWVENLRPENAPKVTLPDKRVVRTTPGGYVQAPSMTHAMSAAVLRNAYLTHLGQTDSPYAIDLSSAQVRMGRFLLDSVRNGQPIGAVLGYLIERGLHDQGAESIIDPIRGVAPLVANKTEDSGLPADTVAARNVVDGLTLRNKWKAGQLFGSGGLPPTIQHRSELETELGKLDRHVDAVADMLLAESVHQVVRGSTMASGAGMDALAQGTRPPDPDIGRARTGGTTLTHRLAVVLPTTVSLPDGWGPNTPRSLCEPRLDAWVGTLLGDPRSVKCSVEYFTTDADQQPTVKQNVTVTLDQLALRPLDVLAVAKAVEADPAASELDRRVLYAAFKDVVPADLPDGALFKIVYVAQDDWDRASTRSFAELLDVANAIGRVIGGMRPLEPIDVVLPESARESTSVANPTYVSADDDGKSRADLAAGALAAVQSALTSAIGTVPADESQLRSHLRGASAFGIAAAFPAFSAGTQEGGVSPMPLLDQAKSVVAEIQSRLDLQGMIQDSTARVKSVFGRDFQFLTGFSFVPTAPPGQELSQAFAYGSTMVGGDGHVVDRWLAQAARVREPLGRWRMMHILAEASGAGAALWNVAQLPHQPGASWVGAPPKADEERSSGKLSLVVHSLSGTVDLTQTWYGLFLDEWAETIPNASEHTGIAFRHDDTAGEAAQTILVAVPPTTAPNWDLDSLVACVSETLDLAKIRALDLEALDPYGQLIPGIYLAANVGDETISTPLEVIMDIKIQHRAL